MSKDTEWRPVADVIEELTGFRPSYPTIHRWHCKGLSGVFLETCVINRQRLTTIELAKKFLAERTENEARGRPTSPTNRKPSKRQIDKAVRKAIDALA